MVCLEIDEKCLSKEAVLALAQGHRFRVLGAGILGASSSDAAGARAVRAALPPPRFVNRAALRFGKPNWGKPDLLRVLNCPCALAARNLSASLIAQGPC